MCLRVVYVCRLCLSSMSNLSIGSRHNLYMHRISIGYRIDRAPKHPRAHAPTPPTPAKEPAHPPDVPAPSPRHGGS